VESGGKLKKSDAYQAMAAWVNVQSSKSDQPTNWDGNGMKSKWESYYQIYRDTKREYNSNHGSKFGLSIDDLELNVTTLDTKLCDKCHHYWKFDKLFGERQNVNPTHVSQPALPISKKNTDDFEEGFMDRETDLEENFGRISPENSFELDAPVPL
jgi:hypothetical protein